jgi:hypothetical protein
LAICHARLSTGDIVAQLLGRSGAAGVEGPTYFRPPGAFWNKGGFLNASKLIGIFLLEDSRRIFAPGRATPQRTFRAPALPGLPQPGRAASRARHNPEARLSRAE